jgi:hypothetical protein
MWHFDMFVTLKVFKLIGPSNNGRRHGRGTYLVFLPPPSLFQFSFCFPFKKKQFLKISVLNILPVEDHRMVFLSTLSNFRPVPTMFRWVLFELGRQARPGRQTGIRLYRPVPAEGQNKSWGHRLTAKAITCQQWYLNNKYASLYAWSNGIFVYFLTAVTFVWEPLEVLP